MTLMGNPRYSAKNHSQYLPEQPLQNCTWTDGIPGDRQANNSLISGKKWTHHGRKNMHIFLF